MKKLLPFLLLFFSAFAYADFLAEQQKFPRVRAALSEKTADITATLAAQQLSPQDLNILFVAVKHEGRLSLYAKKSADARYRLLKDYRIHAKSGVLGPKFRQGDKQVPEGFYHIDRFNPQSSFHLSLGLNYPNDADRQRSDAKNLGGDIFIHGSIWTIGCLPMTDDKIKEIYLYAVHAKNSGQNNIPVYVFPFDMTDEKMRVMSARFENRPQLLAFWQNLKQGYDKFMETQEAVKPVVGTEGKYLFN
jgi:murein L,D-transpeptidase YafK